VLLGNGCERLTREPISRDRDQRERKTSQAVNLGLTANLLLAGLKTVMGVVGRSSALLADGINSTSDVAYSVVIVIFTRLARRPPDVEHPYGHTQMETIAALVVGSFVITTAVAVFWNAVNSVFDLLTSPARVAGATLGALAAGLFTILLKLVLTVYTRRVGEQTQNAVVMALAYDHRNDVLSAGAATVGILMGRLGYTWVDPLAGALVALVVLRTGIEILRESSADLMDTVPGHSLAEQITGLLNPVPGVKSIEEIHAHRFGPYLVVNVTIGVEGLLTVAAGDAIASHVERVLYENIDYMRRVYVHYHPVESVARGRASPDVPEPSIVVPFQGGTPSGAAGKVADVSKRERGSDEH
jgi:cation diffusion facilitator family transporter